MIEAVQNDVRAELACQRAYRQTQAGLVSVAADDLAPQPEHVRIRNDALHPVHEDVVLDAGEILADVRLHHVDAVAPVPLRHAQEVLHAHDGALGAFAFAAGVAVGNEAALEVRLHDLHQRMMNDAILEWRSLNQAQLRLAYHELALRAGLPSLPEHVILDVEEVFFCLYRELHHLVAITLPVTRAHVGEVQVFKGGQLFP